jgi:PncC family amidohydrolase
VSYANEAKQHFLNVSPGTLAEHGAVSGDTVLEMAENLLQQSNVDFALSISGIAGPSGGTEDKPVGTVWLGFASKRYSPVALRLNFSSYGRASVRRRAAILLGYFYVNGADLLDIVDTWQYI